MEHSNIPTFKHSNILITLVMILLAPATWATTYYASPTGSAEADCLSAETPGTIARAVSLAKTSGDVVQLLAGEYSHTDGPITLSVAGITLRGATDDPADTVITGPGPAGGKSFTGFVVTKSTVMSNITFTAFYSSKGWGAVVGGANETNTRASNLKAYNCVITKNITKSRPVNGGTWYNCTFCCNTNTGYSGGAGLNGKYYGCVFSNNAATASGAYAGALSGSSTADLVASNCLFVGNSSTHTAGAADAGMFYDCVFTNNSTTFSGGALNKSLAYRCKFLCNKAGSGGAVCGGTTRSSLFLSNAAGNGGAGFNGAYYDCFFTNNFGTGSQSQGGALNATSGSYVTVSNCLFICNTTQHSYGGVCRGKLYDCAFTNNRALYYGGAFGGSIAHRCHVYGGKSTSGANIYNSTVYDCVIGWSIAGNGAGTYEGYAERCVYENGECDTRQNGLAAYGGTLKNCLIKNNKMNANNGTIIHGSTCINCTVVGNTTKNVAAVSGGVHTNCIITANTYDISSGTYVNSLYSTVNGTPTLVDAVQADNARFNEERNLSLPYYYLRQGSPARNAGIDVGWTAESLDLSRKNRLRGVVDLGCYEYQPVGFSFIVR